MLVVTDATKKGILTAKRIKEIANNLHIKFKRIFVVVNRITPELQEQMEVSLREEGLDVIGFIPFDQIVAEYDLMGRTVFEFPDDAPVVRAFDGVVKRIEEELSRL